MTGPLHNEVSQSLWREQSERWLNFEPADPSMRSFDPSQDDLDPDHDPPPAAPAMRAWPRVFPGL